MSLFQFHQDILLPQWLMGSSINAFHYINIYCTNDMRGFFVPYMAAKEAQYGFLWRNRAVTFC